MQNICKFPQLIFHNLLKPIFNGLCYLLSLFFKIVNRKSYIVNRKS